MGFFRLRLELRALRSAIEEFRHAIQDHSEAIHAASEAQRKSNPPGQPTPVVVSFDDKTARDAKDEQNRQYGVQKSIRNWTKAAVIAATIYASIAALQWCEMRTQTKQVAKQFEAQQRPWISGGEIEFKQPLFLVYP